MNITPEELQKLLDEAYQKGKSEGTVHIHYTWCGTTIGDKT